MGLAEHKTWNESRIDRCRRFTADLGGMDENDVALFVRHSRFFDIDSNLERQKAETVRLPLLFLGRELWRRAGRVGGNEVGGDEWLDYCSEIAMSIAFGRGTSQDVPLAYGMLLDGFSKSKSPCSFPHHFVELGATADVVQDRLSDAKLNLLVDEEEVWLEDDGCPCHKEIPFGWWNKPPVDSERIKRVLNDNHEIDSIIDSSNGGEDFLDWSSLRREFAYYSGDPEYRFFEKDWVEAIANDDVAKVVAMANDPAFGHKGVMSLFWCGAPKSLSRLIANDALDLSPSDLAAFAVRNLPNDTCLLEVVERRWPGTLKSYRDEKGATLLRKMNRELIFGAWRRFLGDARAETPVMQYLKTKEQ